MSCLQAFSFPESVNNTGMHELSIAENLRNLVLETAGKEKLKKVTGINICFGQLVQIVPEIFKFAFEECVRDTIAMGARLDIEIKPVKLECRKCQAEFTISENLFVCVQCGSDNIVIKEGKELFVKSIEGE